MKYPIGLFDSGVGGLSLLPALQEYLIEEDFYYIADHAFSPYGNKSHSAMLLRAKQLTEVLLKKQCKIIVVACNTVTTQVIQELRKEYTVSFIGIEPAIKPAASNTKTGVIGVLATEGTLQSRLFNQSVLNHSSHVRVLEQVGYGLVEIVEKDELHHPETYQLLSSYLKPMMNEGMDTLVLGCTHYPFLIPIIKKILPQTINILDNSVPVIKQIKRLLTKQRILSDSVQTGNIQFYSTGRVESWSNIAFTHLTL